MRSRAQLRLALALGVAVAAAAAMPMVAQAQAPGLEPGASSVPAEPIAPRGPRKRAAAAPAPNEPSAPSARKVARKRTAAKGKAGKARKRRDRQPTPAYQKLRDSWQAPVEAPLTPTLEVTGRVPLVLSQVNGGDVVTLVPQRDDGGFSDADLQRAATVFAPKDLGKVHPIAPRLLDLVYRAQRHFQAPMVHVVSGYRKDRAGSRHTQGRALDMVLPGVSNDALAEYVRSFGYCGVGIYPKSGFVHLDVRDKSYFWVDDSLPGERSRTKPILGAEAAAMDRAAAGRGEAPDFYVPDNDAEDKAAAKAYARRAKRRRERAARKLAREAQARNESGAGSKARAQGAGARSGMESASVFGGLPP